MSSMRARVDELRAFAGSVADEGIATAVLLGMGGSSLAPEVMRKVLGAHLLDLIVLDTTHPSAVRNVESMLDLDRTLFIVASKSGTTTETLSHLAYFSSKIGPGHFAAITDPGSPLEERARTEGFRNVFTNPPDIGGRYSALSLFGLVPAALIGADVEVLLEIADEMARACRGTDIEKNPGARLGIAIGEAARDGRDKLTLTRLRPMEALGVWIEQLITESTGKEGKGIVPVVDEPRGTKYGDDRFFVNYMDPPTDPVGGFSIEPVGAQQLGGEFFRWEFATAVAGAILGINPFDQPDVESAKQATRAFLSGSATDAVALPSAREVLDSVKPGDYIALQAYIEPNEANARVLDLYRVRLLIEHGVATTLGFGPRFLHSTGQLHKGGADNVVAIQIVDAEPPRDVKIPGAPYTFGELLRAQADGDAQALHDRGRRVARITTADL
jgi:hypothetical protein